MSPYSPMRSPASVRPLMAVVMQRRRPETTGLEWPRPGTDADQRTFFPAGTSQEVAVGKPSATPAPRGPRNDGQSTPGLGVCGGDAAPPIIRTSASVALRNMEDSIGLLVRPSEQSLRGLHLFRRSHDGHAVAGDEDDVRAWVCDDGSRPGNRHDGGAGDLPDRRVHDPAPGQRAVVRHDNPADFERALGGDEVVKHARALEARPLGFIHALAPDDFRVPLDLTHGQPELE